MIKQTLNFVDYVKNSITKVDMEFIMNSFYLEESLRHRNAPYFGPNGAKELVASVILTGYYPSLAESIEDGYKMVFKGEWGPGYFSNYIQELIEQTKIFPYSHFSEAYRYLDAHCNWIENFYCSRGKVGDTVVLQNTEKDFFEPFSIATLIGYISIFLSKDVVLEEYSSKFLSDLDILVDLNERLNLSSFINNSIKQKEPFFILKNSTSKAILTLKGKNSIIVYHGSGSKEIISCIVNIPNWGVFKAHIFEI